MEKVNKKLRVGYLIPEAHRILLGHLGKKQ